MRRGLLALVAVLALLGTLSACNYKGRPGGVRVAAIGESIARGATVEIERDLGEERQVTTLLINHQHIRMMAPFLPEMVADPDLRILVIQLGVNDAAEKRTASQIQQDINAFLAVAAPAVECVWWLDIKEQVATQNPVYDAMAPRFNQILRGEAARWPNVFVGEFDAWARANPQHIWRDGLHLEISGRAPYADWLEQQIVGGCP